MNIRTFLIAISIAAGATASPMLVTLDSGGAVAGLPGDTVGLPFTLTWSSPDQWLSVTGSALEGESNPGLGVYTDFIGLQGGPFPFFAMAPMTTWSEPFDSLLMNGAGSFSIDPAATPFASDSGQLVVFFDVFDGDPMNGGNLVSSDSVAASFTISVAGASDVPEPATWTMLAIAMIVIKIGAWQQRRRKRRKFFERLANGPQ